MNYDLPTHISYTLPASAIDTIGTKLSILGPRGKVGHLVAMSAVVTTATTVAVSVINVGITGTLDKFGSLTVPVGAAIVTVANNPTISTTDANQIPADTAVLISSDGGSTAGDADVSVTIAWF